MNNDDTFGNLWGPFAPQWWCHTHLSSPQTWPDKMKFHAVSLGEWQSGMILVMLEGYLRLAIIVDVLGFPSWFQKYRKRDLWWISRYEPTNSGTGYPILTITKMSSVLFPLLDTKILQKFAGRSLSITMMTLMCKFPLDLKKGGSQSMSHYIPIMVQIPSDHWSCRGLL